MDQKSQLWTIGHSTRSIDAFLALLNENKIQLLIDVRSLPGSNKFPQFNKENLEKMLPEHDIEYQHHLGLGGRRKVHKDSKNTAWRNQSFRGYADYMETAPFQEALIPLKSAAQQQRTCIMCSEAVWWRCHRSMIADCLKVAGWQVMHILSKGHVEEHPYTSPAQINNGQLSYKGGDEATS